MRAREMHARKRNREEGEWEMMSSFYPDLLLMLSLNPPLHPSLTPLRSSFCSSGFFMRKLFLVKTYYCLGGKTVLVILGHQNHLSAKTIKTARENDCRTKQEQLHFTVDFYEDVRIFKSNFLVFL